MPGIITGGVVLAAVTSLPNAVAAVYLAAKGKGAAVLSTALNSNALNVIAGLMLPAAITGPGWPSSQTTLIAAQTTLIAAWYAGLILFALAVAYRDRGLRRSAGLLIIGTYLVFLGSLLATAYAVGPGDGIVIVPAVAVPAGGVPPGLAGSRPAWLVRAARKPSFPAGLAGNLVQQGDFSVQTRTC